MVLEVDDLEGLLAPHSLPHAPSGWHELVPLAHWLVKAIRPRVFVELGTHAGVSYAAFCSAMQQNNVGGAAFAIDHWQGDAHSGFYEGHVYEELNAFNQKNFGSFSKLLKCSFDDALPYFDDGSIDLLHIDGFHSYEAVLHDFDTWYPKLSRRAVVVFHDINCRNSGFGVWRFWEELTGRFSTFEFSHGNGLGIAAVGAEPPLGIRALVELREPDRIAHVRRLFALAGAPHGRVYEERLRNAQENARREQALADLQLDRDAIEGDRQRLDEAYRNALADRDKAQAKYARAVMDAQQARREAVGLQYDLNEALAQQKALVSSVSWRVTRPLRLLRERIALNPEQLALLKEAMQPDGGKARRVLAGSLLRRIGLGPKPEPIELPSPPPLSNDEDRVLIAALEQRGTLPSVSVLVVVDDEQVARLDALLETLDAQILAVRQILVSISETSPHRTAVMRIAADRDDVKLVVNGAAEGLLLSDAMLLVAGTVTLEPEATVAMACELKRAGATLVYADEIFLNPDGSPAEPFYKPSYSPKLAASSNYMGAAALLALDGSKGVLASLLAEIANVVDVATYISQKAAAESPGRVSRIALPVVQDSNPRRAVLPLPLPKEGQLREGTAAIIIPTRDRLELLEPCIESILSKTSMSRDAYEIIVVDNGSVERTTAAYLRDGAQRGKFKVIRDNGNFNYARLNNVAAKETQADVLVFLNNDTLIIQPDWLARLIDAALEDGIGLVGVKLLYEDGLVQHGGVVLGIQGVAAHADVNIPPSSPGYHGLAQHDREVSAVTGACMATTRVKFWQLGGFDENLAVAFNDTVLCIGMLKAGLRNLQLNSVLVTHLESKSRGLDDTPGKRAKFLLESRYARAFGQSYFLNDDCYSPNLSLQETYKPAIVSRRRKPWRAPLFRVKPRVLILSSTHQRGHGVPVVIVEHVAEFLKRGFEVEIGGPETATDFAYDGCKRVVLNDAFAAAFYAAANDIDIVIPHTPPFFSVARWTGPYPLVAIYDHGEPPAEMFPDAEDRRGVLTEKAFSLALAHRRYCNSVSVKEESGFDDMIVVPLGNSHMASWSSDKEEVRRRVRSQRGWSDKVVVLNVCRFHEAERWYKGVDFFVEVSRQASQLAQASDPRLVFVQCGKATADDVAALSATGIECVANVSDAEMVEIYCAADVYANFSQWEGWNLGIAQALAFGLPVVASDIAAHRNNFDVFTTSNSRRAAAEILRLGQKIAAADFSQERTAAVESWSSRLDPYIDDLYEFWKNS